MGDYDSSEHGVGLKLACLRIGKTSIILSRNQNKVSVGILSQKFINDCGSGFLVAPLVCYEVVEQDCLVALTPYCHEVVNVIVKYCQPLFASEQDLKRYLINHLQHDST